MNFRLTTVLWLFALLAAGMGTFGAVGGMVVSGLVLLFRTVRWRASVVGALVAILAVLVLIALLLPAVQSVREAARRNQCLSQMKQLVLAMHNYHDTHGTFPPAYTVDANGNPLHSWRTLLLPYLEEKPLYDKIRLDEPWDSEYNQQFANLDLDFFRCPGCEACADHANTPWYLPGQHTTNYFVVVDLATAFQPGEGRSLVDFRDGASKTVLILEAADRSVNWMEPKDLSLAEAAHLLSDPKALRHIHSRDDLFSSTYWLGGGNVCFGDGHSRYLYGLTDPKAKALLTINGQEQIGDDWEEAKAGNLEKHVVTRWGHIISFALFIALALAPAFRRRAPKSTQAAGD